MKNLKSLIFISLFTLIINSAIFAQSTGSVTGQVFDSLGAIVVGANVIAVDANAKEKNAVTNNQGTFTINGLAPGKYTVRVIAPKFALYENAEVEVKAGQKQELTIALTVQEVTEQVDVSVADQVSNDPENNKSATVLSEKDIEALPDDPTELEAALQALAGPSAGPNGGQIYIDGFTGGRIPPKESIREIRINQNPFSAEYDRLGFGRIEILTKPGSDKWRGQAFFNFNDESLNARNPFSINRAASQQRFYGGSVSGPIQKGKSSFFIDVSNRAVDNGSLVNALILDPAFNIVPFQQEFTLPTRRFSISPRFDYAINDKNTLVARYSYTRNTADNQGIGDTSLPSRASSSVSTENNIRLTETMIINPKTVNETRFQYEFDNREQLGDNTIPTISVASAFTGGGAQVGFSYNKQNSWELQNYTTTSLGAKNEHTLKFGIRLRGITLKDRSENNFGGTFTFSGVAAVLRANCTPSAADNCILTPAISPIDQYRQKALGNTDPRFNPNQFRVVAGNPLADVSQTDIGLYVSDDWRVSPALTLGFGLRYENQTNISDNMNLAPRLSFAWSPGAGGAKPPKTVIRGGFGYFYDRFSENLTLQSIRFDGTRQLNYVISSNDLDPVRRAASIALLSQPRFSATGVTNVPTTAQIAAAVPFTTTIQRVAPNLQSPYTMQAALGVERQLPYKITLSLFYIGSKTIHVLRSRNINAPVCQSLTNCVGAVRPDPTQGNINEYESSGSATQNQFIANFRTQVSSKISLFGNYRYSIAKSDADGAGSFPAYSYDLSDEYGYSGFDTRHNFFIGGQVTLPWDIRVGPIINASTGRAFNITRGVDTNGDTLFTERPTFAQLSSRCIELRLTNGFCDISNVSDVNATIPRNYGRGPGFFVVNLTLNRTFGFGGEKSTVAGNQGGGGNNRGGNNRGGGGGNRGGGGNVMVGGGGGGGGGFGGFGGGGNNHPYNLTLGMQISNIFNTVNFNNPIGSLNSSRFGQSTGTIGGFGPFGGGGGSGSRRVDLQLRFSF